MKTYLDALNFILTNGTERKDRTGTGTIGVFGMQQRYDLSKGFPAVTTKKLAWKSVVSELLWFIEGSGNEQRLREILHGSRDSKKPTIWTANVEADYWKHKSMFTGDCQKIYGVQWRQWPKYDTWMESVTLIPQGNKKGNNTPFHLEIPLQDPDFESADELVGKQLNTNSCGEVLVLKKLPTRNRNTYYRVQFLSGIRSIVECSRPSLRSGTVQNPYAMTAANGNGCYGVISKRSPYITSAYNMWLNMLERCHGSHPIKTLHYKDKEVFVDSEWRCFSNFYNDIHGLVGFDHWKTSPKSFDLDKDYHGNNFYGRHSTIFLPSWYNRYILPKVDGLLYTATNKKTGEIYKFTSPAFFNKHTKTSGTVDRAFLHQNGETRNWKFTKESATDGFAWRQQFYVDQLADLVVGLKHDPFSRRHIISAWNPGELEQMALPPCHIMAQFYVSPDNKLSCQMYQRSADFFLGVPFNIASYALFTHMLAQECGYEVGEFVHVIGDAHIYLNHIDAVKEQLSREPLQATAKLSLNPSITDVTKFTMADIELIGYESHSPILAPMAV